jgi:hypothetical protein
MQVGLCKNECRDALALLPPLAEAVLLGGLFASEPLMLKLVPESVLALVHSGHAVGLRPDYI